MLWRSILRTIRRSLARYLSILAIIALGVGFFAGLRVTEKTMTRTVDQYLHELNFHDFRLISTLGFTDDDVDAFRSLESVEEAFGSVSVDLIFVSESGSDMVYHAHALTPGINGVDVVAGRLPETVNECVLDAKFFGEGVIGEKITLAETNDEDTLDMIDCRDFTITGIVNASNYINFERGTTALGSGSVSGFVYLLPECFDTDYYTEIYLTLPPSGEIFSKQYEQATDTARTEIEDKLDERAQVRYDDIVSDAQAEVDDAQAEVDDALEEIAENEQKLADAQQEIDDGWETYRKERADTEAKLADAAVQLEDSRAQLDKGWADLEASRKDPIGQIPELAAQLQESEDKLKAAEDEYNTNLAAYEDSAAQAEAAFAEAQAQLDASQAELDAQMAAYEQQVAQTGFRIPEIEAQFAAAQAQIDAGRKVLEAQKTKSDAAFAEAKAQLDAARAQIDDGWAELDAIRSDPLANLPEIKAQLDAAEHTLLQGENDYAAGRHSYYSAVAEAAEAFADAEAELNDAQAEVDDGRVELEDAKKEVADAQAEIDDARADIAAIKPANVFTLDRSSNVGYSCFDNDKSIVSGVARVFPLFFFLVASLVCITTMTRMVSEQRTENGVLKALGYGDTAIAWQYLFYAGSASLIGCILGFLAGSKFLPLALWEVYQIMYSVNRPAVFVLDWGLFALCTALYLFCALGATWLVCHRDLKESAAQLMRPKSPQAGKRIFLERFKSIWKPIPFLHKISIRNILRYKRRMVMMILGIGGCTALLLTGFGIRDSIQPIVAYQFEEIDRYDGYVTFLDDADEKAQQKFLDEAADVTSNVAFLHRENGAELSYGHSSEETNLIIFKEPLEEFVDLHKGKTPLEWPGKGEVVVNYRYARDNKLSVGDSIVITDSESRPVNVTISGIYDNYIYNYVYISEETYRSQCGSAPGWNTAYVIFPDEKDPHAAGAALLNADNVANVSLNIDMQSTVGSMLKSLDYIVLIVLVCAAALAFIVLYNLTNITITERTREIATLKVLGFYQKEQNLYVFRENMILTAISAICGIPMGIALLQYVMNQITITQMYFGWRLSPISYVYSILLTFIFTILVDLALTGKTKNVNMAEAMKAIE